jgi:PAS domain-containing protein
MIRNNIIAGLILFVLLALNGFTILRVNQRYKEHLNQTLVSKSQLCGEHMEATLLKFSSDISMELEKYNSEIELFSDQDKFREATNSLRLFYVKYRDLITKISIYDNHKHVYDLSLESKDDFGKRDFFVVDSFANKRQYPLSPLEKVDQNGSVLEYHYPYFGQDAVIGNLVIELDLKLFAENIFELYPRESDLSWQWILNADGQIILDNFGADSFRIENLQVLTDSVNAEYSGMFTSTLIFEDGSKKKVNTSIYPLSIYNKKMGIMFTEGRGQVFRHYFLNNLVVSIISQLLATALAVFLLLMLARQIKQEKRLKLSEIVLRQVIEHFPMGILILDQNSIIRNINSAAQRMLFLGKASDLVGKDFTKQFLVSNKYLLSDGPSPFMDDSHYLYYEKDGMETVIYRSEKAANVGGEELKLIALIDVSALERSRKGEVAANKAKSDFLAAMSHEIRTPMNGILGMVNSLLEQKTSGEIQGKITVIKKSAELLMTIINDILDFSKIEAGRMMLEEIPFNLTEELIHSGCGRLFPTW